jgi:hypothetical protein
MQDDFVLLSFDAMEKVTGPSKVGGFHYIPELFFADPHVFKEQRILLDLYGLFLARSQGGAAIGP